MNRGDAAGMAETAEEWAARVLRERGPIPHVGVVIARQAMRELADERAAGGAAVVRAVDGGCS